MKNVCLLLSLLTLGVVGCGKEDTNGPSLRIERSEFTIASAEGSTATVSFEVNADWQTSVGYEGTDTGWLTVTPASGEAGSIVMSLSAAGNPRTRERRARVDIAYGGGAPQR